MQTSEGIQDAFAVAVEAEGSLPDLIEAGRRFDRHYYGYYPPPWQRMAEVNARIRERQVELRGAVPLRPRKGRSQRDKPKQP